ncbi:hypothetical protein [Jejuia spongiicola]|uniref:Uncharacterized protein n=1 Tax=Jejuia spongiicola TaxID=2942207 RepID=A0ABT0QD80_9FLAO|nr:hypothetical protein [Gaetbulibacter sp. 4G1]MCL6294890.1 hypothetical protein [Jejuia spongiicola]PIA77454.1 hypothetical protein BFR04_08390 [Gaetbulibacter sp. 4G1]
MEEFLLNNYGIITHCVEAMAALTGVFLFKLYRNSEVKYFIYFLVYLTICDFIGGYKDYVGDGRFLSFLQNTVFATNHWWSTSYWKVGAILFFTFYYSKILKTVQFKNIIKISGYVFFFFSVIYIAFNWDKFFNTFFPIISILGAIIVFLCSVFYFIEVLQSDKILTFYKSINFYISFAIFIWWLIITPLVFYDLYHSNDDWNFIFLKWQIYLFANIFMYSTFTFALIYCKPDSKNE